MTDKDLIWHTLQYLKTENDYVDIRSYWSERIPTEERRIYFRDVLLRNEFISWHPDNHWLFFLTAKGSITKWEDLAPNGLLIKKDNYWRGFWSTTLSGSIGAAVGVLLAVFLGWFQANKDSKTIVLPPIQVVHDTIPVKVIP